MAYAYCTERHCGAEMEAPTPRQIIAREYRCACGNDMSEHLDINEVLLDMLERIETLEAEAKRNEPD